MNNEKTILHDINKNHNNRNSLGIRLNELYIHILENIKNISEKFPITHNENICSRDNLIAYLLLRKQDIRDLQSELSEQGLSSLGRLEGQVLYVLEKVLQNLGFTQFPYATLCKPSSEQARLQLNLKSKQLFGEPRKNRNTRILVTLDSSFLDKRDLIEKLLKEGMDMVRINCAHNTHEQWKNLIDLIRDIEQDLIQNGKYNKHCKILMDLAGSKIRVNPINQKENFIKIKVPKIIDGKTVDYLEGVIDTTAEFTKLNSPGTNPAFVISLTNNDMISKIKIGDKIKFFDSIGRKRSLQILKIINDHKISVRLSKTSYLDKHVQFKIKKENASFKIGKIKQEQIKLKVKKGDSLRLYRHSPYSLSSEKNHRAGLRCTFPEALKNVQIGNRIFIDDGKISGIVKSSNKDYLELEIVFPVGKSATIKPYKGLNLPDTKLDLPALTKQDLKNLEFITKNADLVGLSFVHSSEDIRSLDLELNKLGYHDFPIIAKLETKESINNLARILITGLDLPKFGILIARGDLAVEVGFEKLALIQEDILCLCEASHIPVILATQILENLTEIGIPTRAEITDASIGQRAQCVMLSSGKYILEAVTVLSELLSDEKKYNSQKSQIVIDLMKHTGIVNNQNKRK
ncbi:MAG: pyruvate kinase [Nitrososphaeraceae archaeon]